MQEIIGYILMLLVGIVLGLIGGGGSILTVPILVYLFNFEKSEMAPAYSLFIVGISALIGGYKKYKIGEADLKTLFMFGIPTITSIFLTRKFVVPNMPDVFFSTGLFELNKGMFVIGVFAILMLLASFSMILGQKDKVVNTNHKINYIFLVVQGFILGLITGVVGAGGGFLIIPVLIKWFNLSMKRAIGTSLLIIALNSLFGFIVDLLSRGYTFENYSYSQLGPIQLPFLLILTTLSIFGIFLGTYLSRKIDGQNLKKSFGWFVLIMGIFIIIKEFFLT